MMHLRLIADDLTGALDSAAAFARVLGPQRVVWSGDGAGASVLNSGTRETTAAEACAGVAAAAPFLAPAQGRLSLFKVDSLLRGHAGIELAAVLGKVGFDRILIAPAIPFQGRITRSGRQCLRIGTRWQPTGEDIAATLRGAGHAVAHCTPGDAAPVGISLWDAAEMDDLARIVTAGSTAGGSVLWVGAAGLAAALATSIGPGASPPLIAQAPLLGLIGSDHPVMRDQLAAVTSRIVPVGTDIAVAVARITAQLEKTGSVIAAADLPPDAGRTTARALIAGHFAALLHRVAPPATLFVSGGETLSGVTAALGATGLDVLGEFEPGMPVSRLVGGRWNGMAVVSKSGAFGRPDCIAHLIASLKSHEKDGVA